MKKTLPDFEYLTEKPLRDLQESGSSKVFQGLIIRIRSLNLLIQAIVVLESVSVPELQPIGSCAVAPHNETNLTTRRFSKKLTT